MAIWREDIVDQRERMVLAWLSGDYTAAEVATRFEVSRPTVYAWTERYRQAGRAGLVDRPPVARSCPHRTPVEIERAIVAARQRYGWGPKKLRAVLGRQRPHVEWPAPSTLGAILERYALVTRRRPRRKVSAPFRRKFTPERAGDLMTVDFKGQFKTTNGRYCYPLTVMDWSSRYLLACQALLSTALPPVWAVFVRLFREHGVPVAVLSDNGTPFVGARGLARVSWLAVQLMRLNIQPVVIDPGHPEQNGAHERLHRTLAEATTRPPASTCRAQQHRFDRFRVVYNDERPHEALGQTPPAEHFHGCRRPYPRRIEAMEYPGHYEVRVVSGRGRIRFNGRHWFLTSVLRRERVGLEPIDDGVWSLQFGTFELARLDERTGVIR
jgi:transposase InsO family protein